MRHALLLPLLVAGCTFECGGKALQTIPSSAVCDGVVDCWGGQDERGDGCTTELFYCDEPEPQAILAEQVCDGVEDCSARESDTGAVFVADETDCR